MALKPSLFFFIFLLRNCLGFEDLQHAVRDWLSDAVSAEAKYGHISSWDTSSVTNMRSLFEGAADFNEDISKWDTRNVRDMTRMFYGAKSFNQDISKWNLHDNVDATDAFVGADSFQSVSRILQTNATSTPTMLPTPLPSPLPSAMPTTFVSGPQGGSSGGGGSGSKKKSSSDSATPGWAIFLIILACLAVLVAGYMFIKQSQNSGPSYALATEDHIEMK